MKVFKLALISLVLHYSSPAQDNTIQVKSKINEVKVFFQNAQISRSASFSIPTGISTLEITNLSPFIDENSIQVTINGDVTILGVNLQMDYTAEKSINKIERQLKLVEDSLTYQRMLLGVNIEKEKFIKENKSVGGSQTGYKLSDLSEISAFYFKQLKSISLESLTIEKNISALEQKQYALNKQLQEIHGDSFKAKGKILVRAEAKSPFKGSLNARYVVKNAGWFPNYDVRVNKLDEPIVVALKAMLYQNTGEDWKNIKLTFSNSDPNQNSTLPFLRPYYLSFNQVFVRGTSSVRNTNISRVFGRITDENGEGLPGANVMIKGSTVGTVADLEGKYSLELPRTAQELVISFVGYIQQNIAIGNQPEINISMVPDMAQLDEVVVVGYGAQRKGLAGSVAGVSSSNRYRKEVKRNSPQVTTIENQTNIEYTLANPYSFASGNEKANVVIKQNFVPALFEYQTVPKLDQNAYLISNIIDWSQYDLIEAPTNLYFENTFIGKTIMDAGILSDTLSISLGQDKNVLVQREKVKEFEKRQTIGGNKTESKAWKTIVRNTKDETVSIRITDQIPVSTNSEIQVDVEEVTGGALDETTGEVIWNFEIPPNGQKEVVVKYRVKYPKNKKLIIN